MYPAYTITSFKVAQKDSNNATPHIWEDKFGSICTIISTYTRKKQMVQYQLMSKKNLVS